MIVVVDYGMGNLRSVGKAFERLGVKVIISSLVDDIRKADKIILPGVGHFKYGMEKLISLKLINILNIKVLEENVPVLGICLGMQLMTSHSEEGDVAGLNWVSARTKKFQFEEKNSIFKVPHMGWNSVTIMKDSALLKDLVSEDLFYFVHSYYVACNDPADVLLRTDYNIGFDSGFVNDNISGFQFHPEKSHKKGLCLLKNFIDL
jgi:glutamine amidotransferase